MVNWDGQHHVVEKVALLATVEVNGKAVKQAVLRHQDNLTIGQTRFRYIVGKLS
jgi:hypothetical protein